MRFNIVKQIKELETRNEELESNLNDVNAELEASKSENIELKLHIADLEKKANGIPVEEFQALEEKNTKLEELVSELGKSNEELQAKMTDFEKATADKAIDILADCGSDPVVTEPSVHPAMTQTTNRNERTVVRDVTNQFKTQ